MGIFERVLSGSLFSDVWTQVRQHLFTEGRFRQLITLKPIEIYKAETELEIDGAKVKLFIKSDVDNVMRRGIEKTISFLTFSQSEEEKDYGFDVIVNAQMPYSEVDKFFNYHFANKSFKIINDKYELILEKFEFGNDGTRAIARIPFVLKSNWWFFRRNMVGEATLDASIAYNQPKDVIKTRNLSYELKTKSWVLKLVDYFYYNQIIAFLTDFLVYNFQEELLHVKQKAQEQIDSFQSQNNWVNGTLNEVELDRVTIEDTGVYAVFLAEGKLHLIR